jgi:hypothetical protein
MTKSSTAHLNTGPASKSVYLQPQKYNTRTPLRFDYVTALVGGLESPQGIGTVRSVCGIRLVGECGDKSGLLLGYGRELEGDGAALAGLGLQQTDQPKQQLLRSQQRPQVTSSSSSS